ncbi:MAG: Uma2 family endonuclease [Anaerolineae bacterium]|nr:Uma2 family endonuclease [Anaerolineae bacterium]
MVTKPITMTVEQFDQYAALPENADRLLEYVGGEIYEVVSSGLSSMIAVIVGAAISAFVLPRKLGFFTGSDGGYMVAGERYMPDVAFISRTRQAQPHTEGYNSLAPDLAVEVLSPSNSADEIATKVANYLSAGTIVWVFDPIKEQVRIFAPGKPVQLIPRDGVIDGGDVLPGFTLKIAEVFDAAK